ncbi:hypothetical protein C7271_01515 [filamentous cyanobacterium CCP5]|nr:hypothetical protein C7271_01515 [filamentous cyanobacterium CCP5]
MTNGVDDRLSRIEAILERTAQQQAENSSAIAELRQTQERNAAAQAENSAAIAQLRQAQERTHQKAEEVEETADDNAQYLGETRAMLETTIYGIEQERVAIAEFRQAMVDNFADTYDLLQNITRQVQQNTDHAQALQAEQQEWNQRFDNLLQDARADRQEMREARAAWEAEHREWSQRFDEQQARIDERAAANEAEHNAFRQTIQTLLAEIARLWNRLSA